MYREQVSFLIALLMIMDGLVIIASGYGAANLRSFISGGTSFLEEHILTGIILFVMFTNNFSLGLMGLYSDKHSSFRFIIKYIFVSTVLVFAVLAMALYSFKLFDISRAFLGSFAVFVLSGLIFNRLILDIYLKKGRAGDSSSYRVLLVGSGERVDKAYQALTNQKSWGHKVVGLINPDGKGKSRLPDIPYLGGLKNFNKVLSENGIDEVVFALPGDFKENIKQYFEICEEMGIAYRIIPAMYEPSSPVRMSVEHIQNIPFLSREITAINASGLIYKRLLDYFCGLIGFILLCVMYPFIAAAIKLDSPGPVFYTQLRMGKNGRIFKIFKFRTMISDAENHKKELMNKNEMNGLMFKMKNDPRITKVGRFLRKTSLDEFPQFINVIKGEMSLVGTRPPTLDEAALYEPWQRRRISMKPGITGLWQVSGRNKINDFNEVVKLDLQYIDKWRFINDIRIIMMTLWVVLKRKGAI